MSGLKSISRRYFEIENELNPVAAMKAGLTEFAKSYGRYDSATLSKLLKEVRVISKHIREIKVTNRQERIDQYALFNSSILLYHKFTKDQPQKNDPLFWVEHLYDGFYQIQSQQMKDNEKAEVFIARLKNLPKYLYDASQILESPKALFIKSALNVNKTGLHFIGNTAKALKVTDHPEFQTAYTKAIQTIQSFNKFLVGSKADPNFAVGRDTFKFYIEHGYMLPYEIDELWNYGMKLKEQTEARLMEMAKTIWKKSHWHDVLEILREDHPTMDDLVSTYQKNVDRAKSFVEEHEIAPKVTIPLQVEVTPPFLQPTTPFAAYSPPAIYAKNKSGRLYVTVPKKPELLRDHSRPEIVITAVHETYPGHHLQGVLAEENPSDIRKNLSCALTVEGWALYCESMMGEQGFYTTPEEKFFVSVHLLWRAIRVLLDIGLQTKGIEFDAAVKFLKESMNIEESNAHDEVLRYCNSPTQPLSYAIGRREFLKLRNDAQLRLLDFHKHVLSYSGLPVTLMRYGMNL